MFKAKYNSTCYSFHGDLSGFYNRGNVHTQMFGYDKYYALEDYLENHPNSKEDPTSFINGWVDDKVVIEWEKEVTSSLTSPFLSYQIMTVSHTPFLGNPKEKEYDFGYKNKMLYRYIAYMRYVDDYLGDLYETMKNDTNTVYVLYGDHGSFLTNKEQKELFGKQDALTFERNNTRVPGIIFDGSGTLNTLTGGNMTNNLVRSEIDMFTTIVDLFNLNYTGVRLGVNGLSNEKTFAYNPNTFTIVTDDYIYYTKNDKYKMFNTIEKNVMKEQVQKIKDYKLFVDMANRYNLLSKEV
jgi:arylsulfatase A-like enzyme